MPPLPAAVEVPDHDPCAEANLTFLALFIVGLADAVLAPGPVVGRDFCIVRQPLARGVASSRNSPMRYSFGILADGRWLVSTRLSNGYQVESSLDAGSRTWALKAKWQNCFQICDVSASQQRFRLVKFA
jgi:hypothetical protein